MSKSFLKRTLTLIALSLIFSVLFINANAQGNLLVNPKRVIFEGNRKIMELNLANTGIDSAKYNISFLQYRMKDDGGFEVITQADSLQRFADKFLRVFPRTVLLGPNEAQVVKVQLTRTNLLEPGEYRSHLYFRAVPDEKPLGDVRKDTTKNISVKLVPIFGISIPIIIRSGESNTQVNISDLSLKMMGDTIPQLKIQLNRTGNMSVYGDLKVIYISPKGVNNIVGIAKGVSVYTPNLIRNFVINLDNNKGMNFREGKIKVEFTAQPDAKAEMIAQSYLKLN